MAKTNKKKPTESAPVAAPVPGVSELAAGNAETAQVTSEGGPVVSELSAAAPEPELSGPGPDKAEVPREPETSSAASEEGERIDTGDPDPIEEHSNFLGVVATVIGESTEDYSQVFNRVSKSIFSDFRVSNRTDFLLEIWIRDFVDLTWEILRWRRYKSEILDDVTNAAVHNKSQFLATEKEREALFERLTSGGSLDDLSSEGFILRQQEIERLDTMTMRAEMRRAAIYREIERYRDHVDRRAFQAAAVAQAEFDQGSIAWRR